MLTPILLMIFGSFAFIMLLTLLTWAAAQAGAGREFAREFERLYRQDAKDAMEAIHQELLDRTDAILAVPA